MVLGFVLGGLVTARTRHAFPVATALINLTGSFALGLLTGIAGNGWLAPELTAINLLACTAVALLGIWLGALA